MGMKNLPGLVSWMKLLNQESYTSNKKIRLEFSWKNLW